MQQDLPALCPQDNRTWLHMYTNSVLCNLSTSHSLFTSIVKFNMTSDFDSTESTSSTATSTMEIVCWGLVIKSTNKYPLFSLKNKGEEWDHHGQGATHPLILVNGMEILESDKPFVTGWLSKFPISWLIAACCSSTNRVSMSLCIKPGRRCQ